MIEMVIKWPDKKTFLRAMHKPSRWDWDRIGEFLKHRTLSRLSLLIVISPVVLVVRLITLLVERISLEVQWKKGGAETNIPCKLTPTGIEKMTETPQSVAEWRKVHVMRIEEERTVLQMSDDTRVIMHPCFFSDSKVYNAALSLAAQYVKTVQRA